MSVDGSNLQRLTDSESIDTNPQWSPNGAWIAFESRREGASDIFVMRPNGNEKRNLTRGIGISSQPAWSPDSRRIAFTVQDDDHAYLYLVELDRFDLHRLPPTLVSGHDSFSPLWSPDGEWILFSSPSETITYFPWNLYRVRPDGSDDQIVMSTGERKITNLRYSWDRQRYVYNLLGGSAFSMSLAGQDVQPISRSIAREVRWSPDGSYALYQASLGRSIEIWRVGPREPCKQGETCLSRLDFDGAINLTHQSSQNQSPSWSPLIDMSWRWWINALLGVVLLAAGLSQNSHWIFSDRAAEGKEKLSVRPSCRA